MSPVANCDFNHNCQHGNATTAKVVVKQEYILQTTFHGAFPKQTGFYGPNEARGLIPIVGLIIMLISETRPLPKCS